MQQPFSQPGGSYGNAPYAAPPQKRGFNWLTCCLGCLGILVIIAIVIGVYVARNAPAWRARLEKAAGPPITASNYRAEFPAGVPVYPGLTLNQTATTAVRMGSGIVAFVPKAKGASLRLMAFQSPKGIDVVGPWYKGKLTPQGWSYKINQRKGTSWEFLKGDTTFFVSETENQRGMIVIGVGKGLHDANVHFNP